MPMFQPAPVLHPGYRSGAYYSAITSGGGVTTNAMAADTIYLFPIVIDRPVTIDGLSVRVGAAVVATNVKMALYDNAGGPAGAKGLISACIGTGDMNETAGNTIALDLATPYAAQPGVYWAGALFNGLAQPHTLGGLVAAGGVATYTGASTMAAYTGTTLAATRFVVAQSYASGFPASLGAPTIAQSNTQPIIGWYPV